MLVPLSWLKEFTPVDLPPDELAEVLAELGFEVEGIEAIGGSLEGIVAARVLETAPHPDADRIQLVQVDPGDGGPLQVCCGAFNMSLGDVVPLATVGTTMPGGMEIAARKMRGQVSNGMLCSAEELDLGGDQSGIMILDAGTQPGTPVSAVVDVAPDVVFDLDVLPNRPDALSILGIARDLAARLGLPLTAPDPQPPEAGGDADGTVSVEILDATLCGRFMVRMLSGVGPAETPSWMVRRLTAAGMRPISAVVDVSNYVMLELGQPNHTYDLAQVDGGCLRIRRARPGEQVETLDGVTRTLSGNDGVIADGNDTALGIAGVMGGSSSEISEETTDIVLELAWWNPIDIAASSSSLNLHSEASLRFKRGVDPEIAPLAARRFAELLGSITGSTLHPGAADERGELPGSELVTVRTDRVNTILGTGLDAPRIAELLRPIGFTAELVDDDLEVAIPSWRPDCTAEIDVVEEVGRHHGLARIAKTVPSSPKAGSLTGVQQRRRRIRSAFIGAGLSEAMPLPFLAPGDLQRCGLGAEGLRVANPLAAEESVLRTSPMPGLLAAVGYNAARRMPDVRLFEVSRLFGPGELVIDRDRSVELDRVLTGESEFAAAVLAGGDSTEAVELLEVVLAAAGVGPLALRSEEVPGLHPGRSAIAEVAGLTVGSVGEINPEVASDHGIDQRVGWLQLDLDTLARVPSQVVKVEPVSRFPSTDVDLAFVVDERVPAAAVGATIHTAGRGLATDVGLFDVFRADQLGTDRKSLAYRIRFCAADRTLTDGEVGEARSAIIEAVESTHGAQLRG